MLVLPIGEEGRQKDLRVRTSPILFGQPVDHDAGRLVLIGVFAREIRK